MSRLTTGPRARKLCGLNEGLSPEGEPNLACTPEIPNNTQAPEPSPSGPPTTAKFSRPHPVCRTLQPGHEHYQAYQDLFVTAHRES